jgi:two-component system phosphate regulon response regulator PhoB
MGEGMQDSRILVVDDEEDIVELVRYNLQQEQYQIQTAESGELGLRVAQEWKPDLMILDIMLPGINGLDVCRALKSKIETSRIPVIMISARGDENDVVAGLELGADDYLVKPFSPKVLLARVKAVLRRHESEAEVVPGGPLNIHELVMTPQKHEATIDGLLLDLTSTEYRVLHFLASHPGWVFTRKQVVVGVHGDDYPVTERSVDVQIAGLRKKMEPFGDYIETVRGVGYRFKE